MVALTAIQAEDGLADAGVTIDPADVWRACHREAFDCCRASHPTKEDRLAWGLVENAWHMRHGERVPRDLCAACRRPIASSKALDQSTVTVSISLATTASSGTASAGGPRQRAH
jgi:hypothetical protein